MVHKTFFIYDIFFFFRKELLTEQLLVKINNKEKLVRTKTKKLLYLIDVYLQQFATVKICINIPYAFHCFNFFLDPESVKKLKQ